MMILVIVLFFVLMTKTCKTAENFATSWSQFLPKDKVNCNKVGMTKDDCCNCIQGYSFLGEAGAKNRCKNIQCNADFTADYRQGSTGSAVTARSNGSTRSTNTNCTPRCLTKPEVLKIPKSQRWTKLDFKSCNGNPCHNDMGNEGPHCQKKYNPCSLPGSSGKSSTGTTRTRKPSTGTTSTGSTITKAKLNTMSLKDLCNRLK